MAERMIIDQLKLIVGCHLLHAIKSTPSFQNAYKQETVIVVSLKTTPLFGVSNECF